MTTASPRIATARVVTVSRVAASETSAFPFFECPGKPGHIDVPRIYQAAAGIAFPVSVANRNQAVSPPETGVRKMNNIITFKKSNAARHEVATAMHANNVVSLDDWRSGSHPVRTPSGVFFVPNVWGSSGDAA